MNKHDCACDDFVLSYAYVITDVKRGDLPLEVSGLTGLRMQVSQT